jgi:glycine amidinotransferase
MINSNTGFGKLKEVIVGRELSLTKRLADITFQQFYKEAINESVYGKLRNNNNTYTVNQDLIDIRNEQLDGLAQVLEEEGIIVHRPDKVNKIQQIKTPYFTTELSSCSNVRDITLIYKDKIIETPTYVRNRYFENISMYNIFDKSYDYGNGGQWIKSPHTKLSEDRIDLTPWNTKRDYVNFDKSKYDMAIDGAQFLRIGKDCIVNVNSYNHYLGFLWIKSLFPETDFHMVNIADNHIDGAIVALREGTFLVDHKYKNIKDMLPEKFQNWEFLIPDEYRDNIDNDNKTDVDISLASSRGMDINVLSIDENTVVVNEVAHSIIDLLEEHGFRVIKIKLENGEIFGGGIHCSTLDLVREDEYKWYQ